MASALTSDDEPQDEAAIASPALGSSRKRPLIMAAGALALIAAGLGSAWFSGLLGGAADDAAVERADAAPVYYALPEILVSLNTAERRSTFLKAKLSLELARSSDESRIQALMPRIVDYCHVYLRELRVEEVRGSAGSARLREELLRRIAAAVSPIAVRDVLFDELFVQ